MKKLKLAISIMIILLFSGCLNPATSIPSESNPAPDSELGLYEAYKILQNRLDQLAVNTEAKRYLADFLDMADGMWEISYANEYDGYYIIIQQLRDSHPNTYYYKSYWKDAMWYLDNSREISPDANARRIEADLFHLSNGGFIESNPNYYSAESTRPISKDIPETTSEPSGYITSSDVTEEQGHFDNKEVTIYGQTCFDGRGGWLLVDGNSAIQVAGNTVGLKKGFYSLSGVYDANTNTLNVTQFAEEEMDYLAIEKGREPSNELSQVKINGLIATAPKVVANTLADYISIYNFPGNIPVFPYVVYAREGFYLILSDIQISLPAEFTFLHGGEDYSFSFSGGTVEGMLVKTPLNEINFGPEWEPGEFSGVVIACRIQEFASLITTIEEINTYPEKYAFNRVLVTASYMLTTATIDYSDMKIPMGQGVLAESFSDLFTENSLKRLETIDPEAKVWQLRECQVTGTVIYPTEEILRYLDYSVPLSKSEVSQQLKPALIVDTITDEEIESVDVSQLNPIVGNPSQYWGKIVEFDAYALGINYPLKTLAETVTTTDIPVNVNLLAVGIADKLAIGSQLAIIGLNNDLIDEYGETITGKFRFRVAVTRMPEELVSEVPFTDTVFFMLSKEELPVDIPVELFTVNFSADFQEQVW